ncbi:MAG: glutamate 5-kinase [Akkermansia sp.]
MRIVVKVGTGVLTKSSGTLDEASMVHLTSSLADLMSEGHSVVLVSSGAVGAGVYMLGLDAYPSDLSMKQACAAVGQTRLMHVYEALFGYFGINVAQLLLTADDLRDRRANVHATLDRLSENGRVLPIINENDTVSVSELRFGDNDILSVLVAELIQADRLFLLTGVDGLYPPGPERKAILPVVEDIDAVMDYAGSDKGKFSMGGMGAKLQAVKRAVESGVGTYIVHGRHPERIKELLSNTGIGTYFPSKNDDR